MPPIENPKRSTCLNPMAWIKVTASSAICSMEFDGEPLDAPTPRLSKAITWCLAAMPSTIRGSQLSSTAARWARSTTGVPPFCLPNSRYAKLTSPAVRVCVGTLFQVSPKAWLDACWAWVTTVGTASAALTITERRGAAMASPNSAVFNKYCIAWVFMVRLFRCWNSCLGSMVCAQLACGR